MILSLVLLSGLFTPSALADPCESSFRAREDLSRAAEAAECLLPASMSDASGATALRAALAMSRLARLSESADARRIWIGRGLAESAKWIAAGHGFGTYWRGAFSTLDANERDGRAAIPRHLLRALGGIRRDFRDSLASAPATHFHGPVRSLGIIDLSTPVIVGGDPKLAFERLEAAHRGSPESTVNRLWYAKALIRMGRSGEARAMLEALAGARDEAFDPDWAPEDRENRAEAAKILKSLE